MQTYFSTYSRSVVQIIAALLAICLTACERKPQDPGKAPPPEVAVFTVTPQHLAIETELPGRLEAVRVAEVRARVSGIVLKRRYEEGSDVRAGSVLFLIDPAPARAAVDSAEAGLRRAEAEVMRTQQLASRYLQLIETEAISRQELDNALADQKQAVAEVATNRAAVEIARLKLSYATVTAPIAGRVGKALRTEGALASETEATSLTTVTQLDPIYVNFMQSADALMQLRRALGAANLRGIGSRDARITLLVNGEPYPLPGKLLFSSSTVEPDTGAVFLRAEFPNPNHHLLPGLSVRVRLVQAVEDQAILIPKQALLRSPQGASVMVVKADNKIESRPVEIALEQTKGWLIRGGLQGGDRVVVEGLQKIAPGAQVRAVAWQPASGASAKPQKPGGS